MKKSFIFICLLALLTSAGFSKSIEDIVLRNREGAVPTYSTAEISRFEILQKKALNGDPTAQNQLIDFLNKQIHAVYAMLNKQGGLLFSSRRPVRGFDDAETNYAVNLEEFFKKTCDNVRVRKKNFDVCTKSGFTFSVGFLKYRPADESIEVKADGETLRLPLADLSEKDRLFVQSALADELFNSSREFTLISDDFRRAEIDSVLRDNVSGIHEETGEQVDGAFVAASADGISRWIILENKGLIPLKNLLLEYQSFADQMIMKMPRDFPHNYRCAGLIKIETLAPGEVKRVELPLPDIITAKQQTVTGGDWEYYMPIPSDLNQESKGRMNGVWVKVHRLTPYGERLTREYKSSGVPSVDWENVVPTVADVR